MAETSITFYLAILSIIGVIASWAINYGMLKQSIKNLEEDTQRYIQHNDKVYENQNRQLESLNGKVNDVEKKVARLDAVFSPFEKLIDTSLTNLLKHPDSARFDELLNNFRNDMPINELYELRGLLEKDIEQYEQRKDIAKTFVAKLVLSRIEARVNLKNIGKRDA